MSLVLLVLFAAFGGFPGTPGSTYIPAGFNANGQYVGVQQNHAAVGSHLRK